MIIGLTGGIGTGKSTVSAMLKERGAVIIDNDLIARQVAEPGQPTLKRIAAQFGEAILSPDGQLDRKALGARIFSNDQERKLLEQIIHPAIIAEIHRQVGEAIQQGNDLIIVDSPLLIEVGLDKEVDVVVLVYTNEQTQLKRIMDRDQLSKEEALKRIKSQMPIDEKRKYADIIVENTGNLQGLEKQVEHVVQRLRVGEV